MGLTLRRRSRSIPDGFPPEVVEPFEKAIGKKVLWNKPASGTTILEQLGDEHVRTGRPILYTSGDSVFQIAGHEEVVPIDDALPWCRDRPRHPEASTRSGASSRGRSWARTGSSRARTAGRTSRSASGRTTLLDTRAARGQACHTHRQDRGHLLGTRRGDGRPHGIEPRRASRRRSPRSGDRDDDFVFTNLVRLRHEVRAPERPGGIRARARGAGLVRSRPARRRSAPGTS